MALIGWATHVLQRVIQTVRNNVSLSKSLKLPYVRIIL
jgi:hypothetical protein